MKPSMAAQALMRKGRKAQGRSPVLRLQVMCYIVFEMLVMLQNQPMVALRARREGSLSANFQEITECLAALLLHAMPRSRGVPRRGGRSGTRVVLEDLYPIEPIDAEPPSSPSSEQECLLPQGTYQTFRFRFPSRLVRPEVVVTFTVFIFEEEPGRSNSSSPAAEIVQGSDILLGDMEGVVYRTRRHAVAPFQPAPAQQVLQEVLMPPNSNVEMAAFSSCAPIQGNSGYAASVQEVLPPPTTNMEVEIFSARDPPEQGEPIQNEDEMVIWLDSPSPDKGKQEASFDQPV